MNNNTLASAVQTHCTTTFGTLAMLDQGQRLTFLVLNVVVALSSAVTNAIAIKIIIQTGQIRNQSIKLVFYLSVSNVGFALIGQPVFAAILYYGTELSCTAMRIMLFVIEFFLYSSTYLTGMLGFDRFMRIRYLNSYSQVYSRGRFTASIAVAGFLVLSQTGLSTMSRFLGLSAVFITLPINILIFATVACLYGKSIFILKRHEKNVKKMSRTRKTVQLTRLASLYIASDILFSVPLVLLLGVYYFFRKDTTIDYELKGILFYTCFLFFICHCPANALCFLISNKKAKSRKPGGGSQKSDDNMNSSSFNDTLVVHSHRDINTKL